MPFCSSVFRCVAERIKYSQESYSFELDVVLCSVSVIPLQHRICSVCMSFDRLGHHNGQTAWP